MITHSCSHFANDTRYFMKRENEPMNLREVMEAIPRR